MPFCTSRTTRRNTHDALPGQCGGEIHTCYAVGMARKFADNTVKTNKREAAVIRCEYVSAVYLEDES